MKTKNIGFKYVGENNLIPKRNHWWGMWERKREGVELGRKWAKQKARRLPLKAIGLSELNHRVPAVQSDSALALNITPRWPDMDTTTATKMEGIKEVSQHRQEQDKMPNLRTYWSCGFTWWHFKRVWKCLPDVITIHTSLSQAHTPEEQITT